MPKAAVYEDSYPLGSEDDVGTAAQVAQRLSIDAITEASVVQLPAERHLRLGIALAR